MKPPRFPRFIVGTSSSLIAITAGAFALVLVPSAWAVDVVHVLPASSTNPWSTASWSNGVPNAIGDIATYATGATTPTTDLDISPTLGSLRMTAGTSWAITSLTNQAITFDGTGMSAANNGFGNPGVASIFNNSGGSNLAARVSMVLSNTNLDIGVSTSSTGSPFLNIGSMTLNATSITNADAAARSINFRLNATAATTNATAVVNSAIGAMGTGGGGLIHINNLSSGAAGNVNITGNLGSLVGNVTQSSSTIRMTLSGTNTNSGNASVTAGILSFTNRVSLYNADTAQWNATKLSVAANSTLGFGFGGGAKFTATELAALNASSIFIANSRFGIDNTTTETYANAITDGNGGANSIAFTKLGSGTLSLSGPNTYTGGTFITQGTLSLLGAQGASTGPLGASSGGLPTGSIFFNGGTLQFTATNTTDYSSRISNAASNAVRIDTNGQTVTFASAMTSSGGTLVKTGTGTLILSGANTYTGQTDVSGGILRGSDSAAYGDATNTLTKVFSTGLVQLANGATLQLRANGLNNSSSQTLTYGNQIQVSAGNASYTINVDREAATGGTNKTIAMGNHNVGANTTMNVTGGNGYQLSIAQYAIGGGTAASTVKLNPTTANLIIGNVGGGSNTLSPTMNLDGTSSGNIITGAVANNGTPGPTGTAVLKTNTSTWSLNGTNTYTGATTVNGGRLLVNGSIAANSAGVTVGADGTLGGTGSINTTVSVTGTIAAGNISSSIGDLRVGSVNTTAALNFSSGGTYLWQMGALADDATGVAGTDFDQISLTGSGGNLVLGGTSKLMLDFAALGSDPNSADPFWLATHSWTVVDGEAGVTNTGSTNFSEVVNGSFATGSFATTADALGNVTLVFTPIPEPATAALLLGGVGLLARRRRTAS